MATTISISEFRALLEKAIPAGMRVLAVSPPGCGKTAVTEQVVSALKQRCWPICMPLVGPEYISGYPYRVNGKASHAPFGVLAEALESEQPGTIILDELGGATESTVKAALRFVQFGDIGDKRLPAHVSMVALSNDVTHAAGVMGLFEPMKDRWHTIVHLDYSVEDTVAYGLANDWDVGVLAYINGGCASNGGNTAIPVFDWKPSRDMRRAGATPRSYDYASQWLKRGVEDKAVIEGCVGPGHATALLAYRALMKDLPSLTDILSDPQNASVPENPSARYLVATTLAAKMDGGTFGQAIQYLKRMPKMFRILSVRDCRRAEVERKKLGITKPDFRPLPTSRDYVAWTLSDDAKELVGII